MGGFSTYGLLLTEDCNLGCKYCYERLASGHNKNQMSQQVATRFVEYAFDEAVRSGQKSVTVSFFGGEPTLMPGIIDLICTQSKNFSVQTGVGFSAGIITNATNMNRELYRVLHAHLDIWTSTQLSIDGPQDIQDLSRVTKNGGGSFALIERNMPYWRELYGNDRLNIHGVLVPETIGRLFESFLFFREEWGVEQLWFLPAKSEWEARHVSEYERELEKICQYILQKVTASNSLDEANHYAPLNRAMSSGARGKPCGAGETYCTVSANGDIWPCHHFYFIDNGGGLRLGNVFEGVDSGRQRIWLEYDESDMVGCSDCDHASCYRCIAENYERHGSPFVQIKDDHCEFMLVDQKIQKKLKQELVAMGLINKSDCDVVQSDCLGNVRDCVGKVGDCPKVVSVDDCKFDRKEDFRQNTDIAPRSYDEVGDVCKKEKCFCGDSIVKELLDDMIKVLVAHHNRM